MKTAASTFIHKQLERAARVGAETPYALVASVPGPLGLALRRTYWKRRLKRLGSDVRFGVGVQIYNPEHVVIEDGVLIEDYVVLVAGPQRSRPNLHIKENPFYPGRPGELVVGAGSQVCSHVTIQAHGGLWIGQNCGIASGSRMYTMGHHFAEPGAKGAPARVYKPTSSGSDDETLVICAPSVMEDESALGLNSVVLPGSTIRARSWVGAMSVVMGMIPPDSFALGAPAEVVRTIRAEPGAGAQRSDDARRRVPAEWNDTAVAHPSVACLHHLVEAQADRTPDAVAVVFEDHELTYLALDEQSNRLAHRLQRLGVGPDVLVGVCMERSIEIVVALLAVLKAGGAYIPVDPSYPEDRIRYMLADARAPVLLTQARLAASLPRGAASVVVLDAEDLTQESAARATSAAGPGHLAYVIYTSGSTGQPKGVMIQHRGIVNHMQWMATAFPLGPRHAVLQKTPVSFDASVWEIFAPLVAGVRLVMARPEGHRETAYMIQAVVDHGVTELQLVPTMLELLVADPGLGRCASLERLYVGGEALSRSLVERFRRRLAIDVVNLYGPTECTVQTVVWVAEPEGSGAMEPIGRPIDNTRLYILDHALDPVPVGVVGELHIGGPAVGRGYLGRPDLTAEKFIPDLFAGGGARLYKTGDLARFREDGVVEYLGRVDHQVKVRGFRIDLGEIEANLLSHARVREAAVIVREDVPGDKRIVAYVVAEDEAAVQPSELRSFLATRVPEYMVPSAFVRLLAMPLTPNGKADRRALPRPDARVSVTGRYVEPRSPVEQTIAHIWAEALGLEHVGVDDDFFEAGGHSLLATRIMRRVATSLGVELPVTTIYDAPTVAQLAERVAAARRSAELA